MRGNLPTHPENMHFWKTWTITDFRTDFWSIRFPHPRKPFKTFVIRKPVLCRFPRRPSPPPEKQKPQLQKTLLSRPPPPRKSLYFKTCTFSTSPPKTSQYFREKVQGFSTGYSLGYWSTGFEKFPGGRPRKSNEKSLYLKTCTLSAFLPPRKNELQKPVLFKEIQVLLEREELGP